MSNILTAFQIAAAPLMAWGWGIQSLTLLGTSTVHMALTIGPIITAGVGQEPPIGAMTPVLKVVTYLALQDRLVEINFSYHLA